MPAAPPPVLAVDNLGLIRMQPQPDLFQPTRHSRQYLTGFPLGPTVHHRVVRIPLELHGREPPAKKDPNT